MGGKPRDLGPAIERSIQSYSRNGYPTEHFAGATCSCGSQLFELYEEETQGCAIRVCARCRNEHFIGDTEEYLDACDEFVRRICNCGAEDLRITVGVALYRGSDDIRWLYVGAGCPKCQLAGVYVDWKVELADFRIVLERERGSA